MNTHALCPLAQNPGDAHWLSEVPLALLSAKKWSIPSLICSVTLCPFTVSQIQLCGCCEFGVILSVSAKKRYTLLHYLLHVCGECLNINSKKQTYIRTVWELIVEISVDQLSVVVLTSPAATTGSAVYTCRRHSPVWFLVDLGPTFQLLQSVVRKVVGDPLAPDLFNVGRRGRRGQTVSVVEAVGVEDLRIRWATERRRQMAPLTELWSRLSAGPVSAVDLLHCDDDVVRRWRHAWPEIRSLCSTQRRQDLWPVRIDWRQLTM